MQDVGARADSLPSDPLTTTEGPAVPFGIPKEVQQEILLFFRALQRCREPEDWDDVVQVFQEKVTEECDENDLSERKAGTIVKYFDRNWFGPNWRGEFLLGSEFICKPLIIRILDYFTDIGLPENATRDDIFNVNNWTESSFQVFDDVMLESKKTKRCEYLSFHSSYSWLTLSDKASIRPGQSSLMSGSHTTNTTHLMSLDIVKTLSRSRMQGTIFGSTTVSVFSGQVTTLLMHCKLSYLYAFLQLD